MSPSPSWDEVPFLERDRELAFLSTRLDQTTGGAGGLVAIEGAAGLGKTRLIKEACATARGSGMRVLTARAGELENGSAYGVIRSLFERFVARTAAKDRDLLLAGAAEHAKPVLGLTPRPSDTPGGQMGGTVAPESFASMHGLYWLAANLADSAPLLLVVDDAHWADAASLRFLSYLLPRVEALPILIVLGRRPHEPGSGGPILDGLCADVLARSLQLQALSEAATAAIVSSTLSRPVDSQFCRACYSATGGNPLLVGMLARELKMEGIGSAVAVAGPAKIMSLAPRVVASSVLPRLRRLSDHATTLVRAVAVLGGRTEVRHAAALSDIDSETALIAADDLEAVGIFAPGRPLEFTHPMIRHAIYQSLTPAERHSAHKRAAKILDAGGAAVDRIAAQLMLVEPFGEPWVVDILRSAAREASEQGAPEEAVRYLRRAMDEPPETDVLIEVLFELGASTGRIDATASHQFLRKALALAKDPQRRCVIALEFAHLLALARDTRGAYELLTRTAENMDLLNPELQLRLEAELVNIGRRYPDHRRDCRRRLLSLADRADPSSLAGCILLANLASDALEEEGSPPKATRLAEDALMGGHLIDTEATDVAIVATTVLLSTDRLDVGWKVWSSAMDQARQQGSVIAFATAAATRSCLALWYGRLAQAEADARLADDICRDHHFDLSRRYSLAFLLNALAQRGQIDTASKLLDGVDLPFNVTVLLDGRGRVRAAQHRFADAVADFLECGRRLQAHGATHGGPIPWRANAALALHQLGEDRVAHRLTDDEIAKAERLGVPRILGIALRTKGVLLGGAEGLTMLEKSVALLRRSSSPLELAHALTDLGAALRRSNQRVEARRPLREGLELAQRSGANPLVDRAHHELAAAGARPRRPSSGVAALTPSEQRVAHMAADGMSNRAIAQALFVTVKTVEVHLSSVYRKLDVTSRTKLGALTTASPVADT